MTGKINPAASTKKQQQDTEHPQPLAAQLPPTATSQQHVRMPHRKGIPIFSRSINHGKPPLASAITRSAILLNAADDVTTIVVFPARFVRTPAAIRCSVTASTELVGSENQYFRASSKRSG